MPTTPPVRDNITKESGHAIALFGDKARLHYNKKLRAPLSLLPHRSKVPRGARSIHPSPVLRASRPSLLSGQKTATVLSNRVNVILLYVIFPRRALVSSRLAVLAARKRAIDLSCDTLVSA